MRTLVQLAILLLIAWSVLGLLRPRRRRWLGSQASPRYRWLGSQALPRYRWLGSQAPPHWQAPHKLQPRG